MSAGSTLTGFEQYETVQSGATRRVTTAQIASYVAANLGTLSSLTVSGAFSAGAATFTSTLTVNGVTYTFPSSQTANYFLRTNGSGTLSWAAVPTTLAGQTDVTLTSPASGQMLRYNGSVWVNSTDGSALTALNASNLSSGTAAVARGGTGLGSTPANGQLLVGNGSGYTLATITGGTGITVTNGSGTISIASSLTNPVTGTGTSGKLAKFNGTSTLTDSLVSESGSTVTVTGNLTVTGDLTVSGTTVTINATNLSVTDPIITVGKDNTGSTSYLGLKAERGSSDGFWVFDESTDRWTAYLSPDDLATAGTLANVQASTFYGALSGNATTATTLATPRTINGTSFDGSANITVTATATNALTIGTYLTGTRYNGSSAVTIAVDATSVNTASKVVARDGSGNFAAGTITAALTGNASTATALQNARTINGTSFDGTSNITVTAAAGTLTGTTLNATVVSSSLTSVVAK